MPVRSHATKKTSSRSSSGAPLTCRRIPPRTRSIVDILRSAGSKWNRVDTPCPVLRDHNLGRASGVQESQLSGVPFLVAIVPKDGVTARRGHLQEVLGLRIQLFVPDGNGRAGREPDRRTRILFWVSVPVLSVQITEVDPRVSTAEIRFTSAPRRASSLDAHGESQRDGGEQALRNVRDQETDPEGHRVGHGQSRDEGTDRYECEADPHGDRRDQPGDLFDLLLQRRLFRPPTLGQRCDPTELRVHAGREHDGLSLARHTGRSAEDEICGVEQATGTGVAFGAGAMTDIDSPFNVDRSTSTTPSRRRASAHTPSPSRSSITSPGTSSTAGRFDRTPSLTTQRGAVDTPTTLRRLARHDVPGRTRTTH